MDIVVAIAREVHSEAELDALGRMLPVQLELGVPAAISAAADEALGECVGNDQEAVGRLRTWSQLAEANTDEAPSLDDLLGLPTD